MRFEVFSRLSWRGVRWYFRIRAANGEIVAQSEAYKRAGDARATAYAIRAQAFDAEMVNL